MVQERVERASRHSVLGRHTACSAERICSSIKQSRTQSSFSIHSQLIVSRSRLWWNLKKSKTRKRMCHLDHHRRFPTKISGRAIRILILLAAATTSNESNWNPIPNYQVQGELFQNGEKNLWNVPSLITTLSIKRNMIRSQIQRVRWNQYQDTNPQNVACWHPDMLKMTKRVRWNPWRWIKKRNTKLISRHQNCHNQLWRKQNISEFKSLSKRSKLILIEQHFMPTCSRITSTIHSAKIRRRWSANWIMWSYSSCAKLHQKYNVITVFFIGIKGLWTALADNAWFTANPEEILNRPRLDALSIPKYAMKKGVTHGARHGKTEEQKEYHIAWNAWKRCCKKVDSQGENFTGVHDRFLRDPVYRE